MCSLRKASRIASPPSISFLKTVAPSANRTQKTALLASFRRRDIGGLDDGAPFCAVRLDQFLQCLRAGRADGGVHRFQPLLIGRIALRRLERLAQTDDMARWRLRRDNKTMPAFSLHVLIASLSD